jgi:hypothetical protein
MPNDSSSSPRAPFDPLARYVDQETGFEYENFGSKFAGDEPLNTSRNGAIAGYRINKYTPHAIKAYWQAYDACTENLVPYDFGRQAGLAEGPPGHAARHHAGITAGKATGCWGPVAYPQDASPGVQATLANIAAIINSTWTGAEEITRQFNARAGSL